MRTHSSQRQSRPSQRCREMGVNEKRMGFAQQIFQPQLPSLVDGFPSSTQPMLDTSASTPFATFQGGLPSTPTMGGGAFGYHHSYNSYHATGTPTTPSAPSMGPGLTAIHGIGHGMGGALLRPTALHTPLTPLSGHPLSGGLGGFPSSHPSMSRHQQPFPPALIPSEAGVHMGIPALTPTSNALSAPSSTPGSSRISFRGPTALHTSFPHHGLAGLPRPLQPPPPPAPVPPIPVPMLPCATVTTPQTIETGTPTSTIPSLPVLSGPTPLHGMSQQFVQLPQTNYQPDRIPFDLDFPPHGLFFRLLLDAKLVGGLIGKKGQSIEYIRKQSGAKIHIAKKLPNHQPIMRLVTVSGAAKQVVGALQLVADKIAAAQQDGSITGSGGEPSHGVTLLVDEKNVGCLIGKNGNTINHIRKKTGANVFVSSHLMPQSTEKCIDVSGTKENLDDALEMICHQFVTNPKYVHTRNEYNPQASLFTTNAYAYPAMQLFTSRGLGRGDPTECQSSPTVFPGSPDTTTCMVAYRIDKGHIGGIIGRGGRNIAEIRRQSQANVTIDNDQSNGHRTVTLRGTRQEIALAINLLQHAIAINHPPRDSRS